METFMQLHIYKRKLELGMRQVPPGSSMWYTLSGVAGGLGNLASRQLDDITSLDPSESFSMPTSPSSSQARGRRHRSQITDDEIDEDEEPQRRNGHKRARKEVRFSRVGEDNDR
jgi:hypothetical protein